MANQYKIIGGDGQEYGPATCEELLEWIRDGRMCSTTKTWRDDTASWLHASDYAELAEALTAQPPPIIPPLVAPLASTEMRDEAEPVGFWARLAAYIIDSVVLTFLFSLLWPLIADLTGWQVPQVPNAENYKDVLAFIQATSSYISEHLMQFLPYIVLVQVEQLVYHVLFTGSCGATPGKLAIGARIVHVDGSKIGYQTALWRWLACHVSDFLFYAGYLFIIVRPDKRALHDLMVGTKVIFRR